MGRPYAAQDKTRHSHQSQHAAHDQPTCALQHTDKSHCPCTARYQRKNKWGRRRTGGRSHLIVRRVVDARTGSCREHVVKRPDHLLKLLKPLLLHALCFHVCVESRGQIARRTARRQVRGEATRVNMHNRQASQRRCSPYSRSKCSSSSCRRARPVCVTESK